MTPRSPTLTRRLVLATGLVALASVLITGVAMIGLFRSGATAAAQASLSRYTDTVAATLADLPGRPVRQLDARPRIVRVNRELARIGITLTLVGADDSLATTSLPPPVTAADVRALRTGGTVSAIRTAGDQTWLLEGRSVDGNSVLLSQPRGRAEQLAAPERRRLLLPLALGLAGGALAGLLLARQLARPLSTLAGAARRLSAGERDVRVPPEGPAEVVAVAEALNALAGALTSSEARQRQFLLDVSHELRTPLTAVAGYAEGLAEGVLTGDEATGAGEVIRKEAARLQRRVEDLLALARLEADSFRLEPGPSDLTELVRAAGRAWLPRAEATGVRLGLEVPDGPLVVVTDAERVRQALDALVDNALRVLPAGAPLVLACRPSPGGVAVEVRDGGPGLADEDLAVAFERGQLTERYRGDRPVGSGLGLALVGELARRLGGRAVARHAPEGGVAFTLLLPGQLDSTAPATRPIPVPTPNTPRTSG